ncbi:hypothetical protein [Acinetobacter sp. WZC-1]|uniref:hypothetical protein n=1 Tax=Acinetobacter sp. WZC-1 TaxID=3459034 RepID=UPI00403DC50A
MNKTQRDNPGLMWIIAGGLTVVIVLLALIFILLKPDDKPQQTATPAPAIAEKAVPAPPQPVEQTTASEPANQELINEKALSDEVPQNASLANEELARLQEIKKQLDLHEQILKAQHGDADQLIKLKEEQIKLLEEQQNLQQ